MSDYKMGGFLPSPTDPRDYRVAYGAADYEQLPDEWEPEKAGSIHDQGQINSCAAHAMTAAMEDKGRPAMAFGWIYGNRRHGTKYPGSGMIARDMLEAVQKDGVPELSDYAYDTEVSEIIRLFESEADKLMPKANPNRIGNYYRLMTADECRQAMFEGKMVLLGLMLPPEFANITKENPVAPVPAAGEDGRIGELLGHMVKAHGWRKGQIKCKNSWSEQWGEKGYFYLPDEYFMAHEKLGFPVPLVEAWAVEIDTETQKQPSGWYQAGEKWRYRDSDGSDHKGWLKTWAWFWLGTDGNMAVGWRLIDGKWYYFNSFGVMLDGLHTIDGKQYFFFERSEKGHLHGEMLKTNNSGAII